MLSIDRATSSDYWYNCSLAMLLLSSVKKSTSPSTVATVCSGRLYRFAAVFMRLIMTYTLNSCSICFAYWPVLEQKIRRWYAPITLLAHTGVFMATRQVSFTTGESHATASLTPRKSSRKRSRPPSLPREDDGAQSTVENWLEEPTNEKKFRKLMEGFEDEMTCPM